MFLCEFCNKTTQPGMSCALIATEVRDVVFQRRDRANRVSRGDGTATWVADEGGRGKQIVTEKRACPECAKKVSPGEV
jgi:hypothetical protein